MRTTLLVTLFALLGVSEIQSVRVKSLVSRSSGYDFNFDDDSEWEFASFVNKFARNYKNKAEWQQRKETFKANLNKIKEINEQNGGEFEVGVTKFTDLSDQEFSTMMGLIPQEDDYSNTTESAEEAQVLAQVSLPESIDWRDEGAVPAVRNQYSCGSCYAFSALSTIESLNKIKNGGVILNLAEQQVVDCSVSYGNNKCTGGTMKNVFKYAKDNKLMKEYDYPYVKKYSGSCKYSSSKGVIKTTGYVSVTGTVSALMAAVAKNPVSIGVQASSSVFRNYVSGIISGSSCGTSVDHGVVLVGYGSTSTKDYWIVRNTWGSGWGEKGYVRIDRSTSSSSYGVCGILKMLSYPTI